MDQRPDLLRQLAAKQRLGSPSTQILTHPQAAATFALHPESRLALQPDNPLPIPPTEGTILQNQLLPNLPRTDLLLHLHLRRKRTLLQTGSFL